MSLLRPCQDVTVSNRSQISFVSRLIKYTPHPLSFYRMRCKTFKIALQAYWAFTKFSMHPLSWWICNCHGMNTVRIHCNFSHPYQVCTSSMKTIHKVHAPLVLGQCSCSHILIESLLPLDCIRSLLRSFLTSSKFTLVTKTIQIALCL